MTSQWIHQQLDLQLNSILGLEVEEKEINSMTRDIEAGLYCACISSYY